jgi:hypothetical protein
VRMPVRLGALAGDGTYYVRLEGAAASLADAEAAVGEEARRPASN